MDSLSVNKVLWLSIPYHLRQFIGSGYLDPTQVDLSKYTDLANYTDVVYEQEADNSISTIAEFLRLTAVVGLLGFVYRDLESIMSEPLLKRHPMSTATIRVRPLGDTLFYSCLRMSAMIKNSLLPCIFYKIDDNHSICDLLALDPSSRDYMALGNRIGAAIHGVITSNAWALDLVRINESNPDILHILEVSTENYYDA
ncbi:hypothetical protein Pmar_PMAR020198 [Perkinsus marinus ATCC 50983]|uniref:Uncharacterized protein n=1 Tax=Perkinsus marinus (strain ATCC 50983 / TXsc) TaxID=423536 RepID=C5LPA0_PERM5|nr:hypothetical protein Pmar_PMAR020198 [Perkinsus marinus ATCC 50983]EER01443.1 hypothetical protein Pmar_PMAR020198 [Perkinsus marinus ATCC 50983]|eukprot:XP_002768725.1 hypothetical protein Pmar_PMAR020198 [Perkinsus marinus ATCC 50983]